MPAEARASSFGRCTRPRNTCTVQRIALRMRVSRRDPMTTPTPTPAAAAADPSSLSHRQILTILSGLMLGMFLAALDQTIVATSIRTIADDLKGLSIQAWATTAYLITATISTPLYGKLSDLYGRRQFFIT